MWRAAGWLLVVALALAARGFDSDVARVACAAVVLALIAANAPSNLRAPVALAALGAACVLWLGGVPRMLDAMPALIAALIAWLFARTLLAARRPLIARAIASIDGVQQLDDPHTASYARRLTLVWACWQAALALIAAALAAAAAAQIALPGWVPGPRLFGAVVLPGALAALFIGEFLLRRRLLPQAPRTHLVPFLAALVRAWPALLKD